MVFYFLKLSFITLLTLLIFSGCSDGDIKYTSTPDTNNTVPDTNNTIPDTNTTTPTVTGHLVDAAVEGMNYYCSSGSTGVTLSEGNFTCNENDSIVFELGNKTFAITAISDGDVITPYSFFPSSLDSALNLARLLQSIDSDNNVSNESIVINKSLEGLLPANLDYADTNFTALVEQALSITLIDANSAQARLNSSILASGGTLPPEAVLPVANAGIDQNTTKGNFVSLSANGSVANTYKWTFSSKPTGSSSALLNSTSTMPTFNADKNGTYLVELLVNEGDLNSVSDFVVIRSYDTTITPPDTNDTNTTPPDTNTSLPDTNSAPDINSSASISVYENQTGAFTITASDADNDVLYFSLTGSDASYFNINSLSGVVTFKQAPDYENKNSYSVIANVSDTNKSDDQNVSITILNAIETPVLADTTLSINENMPTNSNVGQVLITSHGDSAISSFVLSGTDAVYFSVDNTGLVKSTSSFDHELKSEYNLSVTATNTIGQSSLVSLNVSVTDLADVDPVLVDTTLSFREDATVGDEIGSITMDSGDSSVTSITLAGTGFENFEFTNAGVLKVKTGASFDYETTTEYNLTAQATNSTGTSNVANLYLSVNNVMDELPILANSTGSLDENATLSSVAANLSITKIGDSNISSIVLTGVGSEYFSSSTDGVITLINDTVLNFENVFSYTLQAKATNLAGDSNEANVTISVNDVAEVPRLVNSSMSIMENKITGAVVGNISINDYSIDSGDTPITAIALSGVGSTNFVSDAMGEVTLSATAQIDHETTPSYTLSAIATNTAGNSVAVSINIDITDYAFDPAQIARLDPSDPELDDRFGSSVDLNGDYMVVGAPNEDAGALSDGGSAYLYKKDKTGSVQQLVKVSATTPKTEEYFGYSVAMDSNVIVVGAPEGASASGDAYIFLVDTNDSVPLPPQKINSGSPTNGDSFGSSVGISGDYVIVGAPNNASVYLYKLDVNKTATLVDTLNEVGLVANDSYGQTMAIDGNYIIVGAKDKTVTSNSNGVVYFYEINPVTDTASLLGTQNLSGVVDYDYFGSSVSVSGSYAVVGAYGIDTIATDAGKAYMYKINGLNDLPKVDEFAPNIGQDTLAENDYFGYSIDISGEYIIAGAYKKDAGAISDAGSAYVYHIDTMSDTVELIEKLDLLSPTAEDYFGASVAIDGDFMIVGAPNEDSNATNGGTVFVFDGEPVP